MASVTSSRARKRPQPLERLHAPLRAALAKRSVPLLVLRLPEFERIAWREGKRSAQRLEREASSAFVEAASGLLRTGDLIAHDPASDVFAVVMTAESRAPRTPGAVDVRSVLERIAAAISLRCGLRVETGWTHVARLDPGGDLQEAIETALERGARERERYEFFSAIGHELRTPLTSIRGYLETLLDEEVDDETRRRFLETARREALRMGRLLEGMFEFSLLDLSASSLMMHSCDVDAQVRQACEVVRPLAERRAITLHCVGQTNIAAIETDACLQLLVNLIDNAVKYGRQGGMVRIESRAQTHEVFVAVEDDGPGIAENERESIFGLRVRGASAATRPGTGIGLAIVKMIAERAGGAIQVTRSALGGARFEVALPRKEESPAAAS